MIYIDDEKESIVKVIGKEDVVIHEAFLILGAIANAVDEGVIDKQTLKESYTPAEALMILDFMNKILK